MLNPGLNIKQIIASDDKAIEKEVNDIVKTKVSLPPRLKKVALAYLQGHSFEAISKSTGIKLSSVKGLLLRSNKVLQYLEMMSGLVDRLVAVDNALVSKKTADLRSKAVNKMEDILADEEVDPKIKVEIFKLLQPKQKVATFNASIPIEQMIRGGK